MAKKEKEKKAHEYVPNQEARQQWSVLSIDKRSLRSNVIISFKKLRRGYRRAGVAPVYKNGGIAGYLYNWDLLKKKPKVFDKRLQKERPHQAGIDPHYKFYPL